MNNRFFFVFFLFLLLCTGCKKQNNNVVGLGFGNLPAYGNPVEEMQDFIKLIDSCDKNPQSCNRLKKLIPKDRGFLYVVFDSANYSYQLVWWSGETTWVYDSNTKKYYETKRDLMNCNWYKISDFNIPLATIKVNLYER